MPAPPDGELRTRDAIVLGLLHGPAELLPVSSSGHVAVVPWLLGWPYSGLDGELRKAFEVALHAGTAAALLVGFGHGGGRPRARWSWAGATRSPTRRAAWTAAASSSSC